MYEYDRLCFQRANCNIPSHMAIKIITDALYNIVQPNLYASPLLIGYGKGMHEYFFSYDVAKAVSGL